VRLTENLREQLKTPLGILLKEPKATKENVLKEISENSNIITVGDATTEKMINFGIMPILQIIDAQEKRSKREPPTDENLKTKLNCDNPAGEITSESIEEIKRAFKAEPPVRIHVNGEEDLLVIPVCIYAPENSIVMYGQPNEGLVIVRINEKIRNKTKSILESMN